MSSNSYFDEYLSSSAIRQINKNVKDSKAKWLKKNFYPFFPKRKSSKLLEIGPGQGELLIYWKELGYRDISSVDISKDVVEHISNLGFECKLVQDTSKFLAKHKSAYDLIVLNDVLEHIPKEDLLFFVKSIKDSLKRGGKVLIKVPNAQSPHFAVGRYYDLTHVQSFTESSFAQLFRLVGFDKFELRGEVIPINKNIKGVLSAFVVRPIYFFWIRKIREATGHISPEILTQAIVAIAIK